MTQARDAAQAVQALERIAARLRDRCGAVRFGAPVAFTYNPLDYAWEAHRAFLRMARPAPRVLFVGMNPGPFGMAQTGVPFGEVASVTGFLGIDARTARIGAPSRMHPKRPVEGFACGRSEVSGARVWTWARERFGTPAAFFREAFVWNWCPLAFMAEGGANLTPDKLPRTGTNARAARALEEACDEALGAAIAALRPAHVVGFGAFAAKRAQSVLDATHGTHAADAPRTGVRAGMARAGTRAQHLPPVLQVLHPSPASPAANRGWAPQVDRALASILPACASRCSTSSGSPPASSRAGSARASRRSRSVRAASAR